LRWELEYYFRAIWGAIYVSIRATIGAWLSLIGRYLARGMGYKADRGQRHVQGNRQAVARKLEKVGLMQLSPLFPFNLLNYAFGVTQVSFKDYFFPTWIGIMPELFCTFTSVH